MPKTLIATQSFTWHGRALEAGDRFDVPPVEAAVLVYRQRRARFAGAAEEPGPEAPTKRRRYKRRDLQAEG